MDSSISRALGGAKNAVLDHRRRRAQHPPHPSTLDASQSTASRRSSTTNSRRTTAPLRFHRAMEALSVSEADVHELLESEGGFQALQQSLKRSGAVTNTLIQQGIHVYVAESRVKGGMDERRMNDSRRALQNMDHSNSSRSSMSDDSLLLRDFSR